jgi:hypothetical protein
VRRIFAVPAARATLAAAAGILAVAVVAGLVRALPLFLGPGVPLRLAPVLGRGIAAVSLEAALFVAPPVGWALAASRLVDRGEARALFAVGIPPRRILASAWPAAAGIAAAAALAAALWGREAAAPGRSIRDLLVEGRSACAGAAPPAAVDVPLIGISWICTAGQPPRAVGPVPGGGGAFAAAGVTVSDDLRAFQASDLTIVLPAAGGRPGATLRAGEATIRGIAPLGRASNLSVAARALLLSATATALAALSGGLALAMGVRSRPAASALGALGPAASLLVFSALERAPSPPLSYLAVPAAGLVALSLLPVGRLLARRAARRPTLPA